MLNVPRTLHRTLRRKQVSRQHLGRNELNVRTLKNSAIRRLPQQNSCVRTPNPLHVHAVKIQSRSVYHFPYM